MYEIMLLVFHLPQLPRGSLDCVELFSGVGQITSKFTQSGLAALGYDIVNDKSNHDLCSVQGFVFALICVMRLSTDGLAWFATVCSSWIWLARASTSRTTGRPLGFNDTQSTIEGNMQVARSAILMALVHAKHAWWALEQPLKSLMEYHPAMAWLAGSVPWFEVSTVMGAFGAPSLKPSRLYSNASWILGLHREKPRNFVPANTDLVSYEQVGSKRRVSGSKGLKVTQEYTPAFGDAVIECFVTFRAKHSEQVDSSEDEEAAPADDACSTAELSQVVRALQTDCLQLP